jgi:preprotein translocase subunit Sec63
MVPKNKLIEALKNLGKASKSEGRRIAARTPRLNTIAGEIARGEGGELINKGKKTQVKLKQALRKAKSLDNARKLKKLKKK